MTKVEELRERFCSKIFESVPSAWGDGKYMTEKKMQRVETDLDAIIAAVRKEERESILGKTQEVRFSDGVNGWTGMLTTELPKFSKTEEGKFYLNTDHIKIIPTEEPKTG